MGKERLLALLNKKEKTTSEKIDLEKLKSEWLSEIELFFNQISDFLNQFGEEKIQYEILPYQMSEELLHTYTTKKMKIFLFNEQIDIVPKGKFIVGAKGRIDMESSMGRVRCVLVHENARKPQFLINVRVEGEEFEKNKQELEQKQSLAWKFVVERPEIIYEDITIDTFSEVLLELIGRNDGFSLDSQVSFESRALGI